ncbi:MAG: hypothetical protein ABFS02_01875 [Pseudomonadota bacterium]
MTGKLPPPMLLSLLLALAGCYEDTDIVLHRAHVYKGQEDAHYPEKHPAMRTEQLKQRFRDVQTDR